MRVRSMDNRLFAAALGIAGVAGVPAHAQLVTQVVVAGDVSPAYNGLDPWDVGGHLTIGVNTVGTLRVDALGRVTDLGSTLGVSPGSSGTATVAGIGADWTSNGLMVVGDAGHGVLNINSRGKVQAETLSIAVQGTALGDVFVGLPPATQGAFDSSRLTIADALYVGGSDAGPGGAGQLFIRGQASVEVGSEVVVYGGGLINLSEDNPPSVYSVTGGAITLQYRRSILRIGEELGTGSLRVQSGGRVVAQKVTISSDTMSDVIVSGPSQLGLASWDVSSGTTIGVFQSGRMTLTDGAVARGGFILGQASTGSGILSIKGQDTLWEIMGRGVVYVGLGGHGQLSVSEAGMLNMLQGSLTLGERTGSLGEVLVSRNGQITLDRNLTVGEQGTGRLTVDDGAVISLGGGLSVNQLSSIAFTNVRPGDALIDVHFWARLDGELSVSLPEAEAINVGDTITLIEIGTVRWGMFTNAGEQDLLYAQNGVALRLTYFGGDGNDVELIAEDWITGDLSGDGFVGVEDLDVLLANWGDTTFAYHVGGGDLSGDGVVGDADLQVVLANWGAGVLPEINIPEPGSLALLGLGGLALLRRTRSEV